MPKAYIRSAAPLTALILLGLSACDPSAPSTDKSPTGQGAAPGDMEAPSPAPTSVPRLPDELLGVFATSPAGCTSDYGPLVVRANELDFGWGQARFNTVRRQGETYVIDATLTAEGQPEGPQRQRYVLARQADGSGVRLTMEGLEAQDYDVCTGPTSGVSVRPAPIVETDGPLPLQRGVYVLDDIDCASPPNAGFRIYNGRGISGSTTRDCRATVTSADGDVLQVENSCIDTYTEQRTSHGQTIRVESPGRFRLTEAGEDATLAYGRCPPGSAPDYLEDLAR